MSKIGILDLFCGTGGFSQGFLQSNEEFEVVGGIDILKPAIETFKLNNPEAITFHRNIKEVRPSEVEDVLNKNGKKVDIIIGGPPCQGFSSIRPFRNSDEDDPRNTLFEQFALFVNYFQPEFFVMENVVGLATHKKGNTIKIIQHTFEDIGYSVDWRILNAANYGVPQKRERLIMIGSRDGEEIVFPQPTHHFEGKTIGYSDKNKIITSNIDDSLPPALSTMEAISDLPPVLSGKQANVYDLLPQNEYQYSMRKDLIDNQLSLHKSTDHSEKMLEIIKHSGPNISYIPQELITSGFSTSYSRLEADEPANTITVNFVHPASSKCIHPYQNRALTPREGARLQSFNDTFKFYGTRTEIVKQIGNAVPPLLGFAIAKEIYPLMNSIKV